MHHKFIKLCGHQLLLWFASSVLIVFFITSNALAEWVSSEGRYFIDRKTTRDEACNIALEEAKQNALKKIVDSSSLRKDLKKLGFKRVDSYFSLEKMILQTAKPQHHLNPQLTTL